MAEDSRYGSDSEGRCDEGRHKHHHKHNRGWHGGPMMGGPIWIIGWLFSIGYLHMPFFWKGVLALLIWPYYLGLSFSKLPM